MTGPLTGADGVARCPWGGGDDPVYVAYHDTEWGMPVSGESAVLERLTLEAFQSGLSWRTILMKREAFRSAFAGFDADAVSAFDDADVARLMADAGIVRNGAKIRAAVTNAAATVALRVDGGLEAFVGKLLPGAGCQGYALCHPQHPDLIAPLPACALELIAAARRRNASAKEQR